jgi:hypothetical protein
VERSRQDEGKLNPSLYISEPDDGYVSHIACCGMCSEDTSLLNTEVGDSLVVRAIE